MQRVNLTEDLSLSRIVHGMWRLADWKFSTEEILSLIEHGMDRGSLHMITLIYMVATHVRRFLATPFH